MGMPDRLRQARKKIVGTKQTLKAVEKDKVQVVFIARDAEEHVVRPLIKACQDKGLEIVFVDTMQQLGQICGIQIGAAAACGEM
jgi:large subunit ribosomal protein L7A